MQMKVMKSLNQKKRAREKTEKGKTAAGAFGQPPDETDNY